MGAFAYIHIHDRATDRSERESGRDAHGKRESLHGGLIGQDIELREYTDDGPTAVILVGRLLSVKHGTDDTGGYTRVELEAFGGHVKATLRSSNVYVSVPPQWFNAL